MDEILAKSPYYSMVTISKDNYPEATNTEDIQTIGMLATFVTHANTSDEVVYQLTKQVFENLNELKTLHPALAVLTPESMLEGHSAPFHPGAEKYYREVCLIK